MSETKEDIYVVTSLGEVLFAAKTKRLAERIIQMLEDCKRVPEAHGMSVNKTKLYSPAKLTPSQLGGLKKAFHNETKS